MFQLTKYGGVILLQSPCENDRHVTDNCKHEVKHSFVVQQFYGDDLADIMNQTGRSGTNMSDASSRKVKKGFNRTSTKLLNRKSSMNMPSLSNTLDTLAFASASKKGKKSFKKQGTMAIGSGVVD